MGPTSEGTTVKIKSTLIPAITIGLLVGSAVAVAAQDEEPEARSVPYSTGT